MNTPLYPIRSPLFMLSMLLILISGCRKQLGNDGMNDRQPFGEKPKDLFARIDSLQQINFFIKDRPNPDMPVGNHKSYEVYSPQQLSGQQTNHQEFPDEVQMVLGAQLNNPYTIPNMTAAYNAYFNLSLSAVQVTHLYLRFSPANEEQVAMLEDSLDLELFTHPLDHEVLIDGDIYVHPGKTIEDLPYLYAVVEPGFSFPQQVPYTILSELHIPEGDLAPLIEEFAESWQTQHAQNDRHVLRFV